MIDLLRRIAVWRGIAHDLLRAAARSHAKSWLEVMARGEKALR